MCENIGEFQKLNCLFVYSEELVKKRVGGEGLALEISSGAQ